MMKTRIHTLLPAALLLLTATACEDTLNAPALPAGNGDGPTLTLALDNNEEKAGTRSTLNDGAPVNNVQTVRILVFKGGTETNSYTDATYVGEEVYADNTLKAISWPKAEEGQEKTDKINYQMNYAFVEGETYTLLGVGLDDKFAETYKFIDNNDKTNIKTGTTLSDVYAILNDGASPKECDFYTGTTTFTHEGKKTHIDDLLMKRRVAGVMLYVNEIPADLPYNNTNYRTTRVDLKLGRTQKKSVQLYRNFLAEEWLEPEGEDLTDSDVLLSIDLSELNYGDKDEQGFYTIDNTTSANGLQDGALKAACYMLPLNVPTEDAADYKTFTVEIYGEKLRSDVTDGTTEEGTEALLKSFTVEQRDTDGKSVTSFPIRSNYLYSIGKYNPDAGVDEPISLSGSPIYLEVLPFQTLEVSHDFGEARVQAVFDDTNNPIYDCINQTFKVKILPPLSTIRGKVDKVTLTLSGTTYALNEQGKIVNIEDDPFSNDKDEMDIDQKKKLYGNWLYIKQEDDNTPDENGTYTNNREINKDQTTEVTFFITDYARPRRNWGWKVENLTSGEYSWQGDKNDIENINNDIRYMDVYLQTIFNDGTAPRWDTLRIRQYNTITVYYNPQNTENQWTNCGFRREDTKENGNKITAAWKFNANATSNYAVYEGDNNSYHGWVNLQNIGKMYYTNWSDHWNGSAMQKAQTLFRKITTRKMITHINNGNADGDKAQRNNGECWYLPARYEMEGILTMVSSTHDGQQLDNHNTFEKATTETDVQFRYWTSTIYDNSSYNIKAWAFHYLKNDNEERAEGTDNFDRYQTGYIRQARRFPDQLGDNVGYEY